MKIHVPPQILWIDLAAALRNAGIVIHYRDGKPTIVEIKKQESRDEFPKTPR